MKAVVSYAQNMQDRFRRRGGDVAAGRKTRRALGKRIENSLRKSFQGGSSYFAGPGRSIVCRPGRNRAIAHTKELECGATRLFAIGRGGVKKLKLGAEPQRWLVQIKTLLALLARHSELLHTAAKRIGVDPKNFGRTFWPFDDAASLG